MNHSTLKYNGEEAWFCPPVNKYGLSQMNVKDITEDDFSFVARLTPDWSRIDTSPNREYGVIVKNGKHCGISVKRPNEHSFVSGTIWVTKDGTTENATVVDVLIRVDYSPLQLNEQLDVCFSYSKSEKKIFLYCNGRYDEKSFEGDIIDYSDSWLWVGASNPLESCPPEFRNYFNGSIEYLSIYNSYVGVEAFSIFEDVTNHLPNLKPYCIYDFKKQTPYKVLDISKNGNNLVKFDLSWMETM